MLLHYLTHSYDLGIGGLHVAVTYGAVAIAPDDKQGVNMDTFPLDFGQDSVNVVGGDNVINGYSALRKLAQVENTPCSLLKFYVLAVGQWFTSAFQYRRDYHPDYLRIVPLQESTAC
jgi:hypothetical protein